MLGGDGGGAAPKAGHRLNLQYPETVAGGVGQRPTEGALVFKKAVAT